MSRTLASSKNFLCAGVLSGDASIVNGLALEGLNNAGTLDLAGTGYLLLDQPVTGGGDLQVSGTSLVGLTGAVGVVFLLSLDGPARWRTTTRRAVGWVGMMIASLLPTSWLFLIAPVTVDDFVAVNLDPFEAHDVTLFVPMNVNGVGDHETWEAQELLTGGRHLWRGSHQHVRLEPDAPARIWRVRRWDRSEEDFDTFMPATVVD